MSRNATRLDVHVMHLSMKIDGEKQPGNTTRRLMISELGAGYILLSRIRDPGLLCSTVVFYVSSIECWIDCVIHDSQDR